MPNTWREWKTSSDDGGTAFQMFMRRGLSKDDLSDSIEMLDLIKRQLTREKENLTEERTAMITRNP